MKAYIALLFIVLLPVVFAATVTPATGGTNISSSTAGGAYTNLTGPAISENSNGDISTGTIILAVPSGFEFDSSASVTVLVTRTGGNGQDNKNINDVASGTSIAVTSKNSTHIVFTVTAASANPVTNSLTWQNVRVRPTAVSPLASGNIGLSGTTTLSGVPSGITVGSLVEVPDTTPPVVSVPANILTEATSSSGAVVNFTATATDNIDGSIVPTCSPSSGSIFAIGTTTVICNATDSSNNTGTNSFTITVVDTTAPSVTVPANIITGATSLSGATVTYTASASDLVDGSITPSCSPSSSSTFSIGTTVVTCNATDSASNFASSTFNITVYDSPPVVSVANVVAEAVNASGAIVVYSANASDTIDGSLTPVCAPVSGSLFPIGITGVTCNATDSSNNTASNSFNVTVQDTTSPVVSVPANIVREATGSSGAPVTFSATASDTVDGSLVPVCNPASSSTFPFGTTAVTCNATDSSTNTGTNSFNITVQDTTPPIVNVPANILTEATSSSGATVTYSANATDIVDGSLVPVCTPASGSTFPLGTTTVVCNSTDSSTNSASNSFNITVQDTTPPIVSVPANILTEATSSSGAIVTFTANATDLIDGSLTPVCIPSSGSTFPLGTTSVVCNSTDSSNNTGTNSFNITVQDTTPPIVNVPANILTEATSSSGAIVTFSANASDIVDGSLIPICSHSSGSTFPLGTTTVVCNSTDSSTNPASNSFNITVQDTTSPVVFVPSSIILAEATGSSGAVVSFVSNATDIVDGSFVSVCNPASGSTFPLGSTIVTCNATDNSNNTATNTFNITIQDTTPPTVYVPANIVIEATGSSGAIVNYSSNASDIVDGVLVPVCAISSGSTFPLGTTAVNCSAVDSYNNTGVNTFNITVQDTTPPVITVPADIIAEATNSSGAIVNFSVNVSDLVDGSPSLVCVPASGSVFALGTLLVNCTANDFAGMAASSSLNVTIVDTTSPSITAPSDISLEATGNLTVVSLGSPVFSDLVDSAPVLTNDSPAGFPVGVTFVNWTATDIYNNSAAVSQRVEINDTTAPIISLLGSNPAQVVINSNYSDAGATANDIVDGSLSVVSLNNVNTSIVGTYSVYYNVTDASNNTAVANRTVNVVAASSPASDGNGNGANSYRPFLTSLISGGVIPSVSPFSDVSSPEPQRITPQTEIVSQPVAPASVPAPTSSPAPSTSAVPKITGAFGLNGFDFKSPVLWSSIAGAALLLGIISYFAFIRIR